MLLKFSNQNTFIGPAKAVMETNPKIRTNLMIIILEAEVISNLIQRLELPSGLCVRGLVKVERTGEDIHEETPSLSLSPSLPLSLPAESSLIRPASSTGTH